MLPIIAVAIAQILWRGCVFLCVGGCDELLKNLVRAKMGCQRNETLHDTEINYQMSSAQVQGVPDLCAVGATLLSQGAEARTYSFMYNGLDSIVKERFAKTYRLAVLDAKISGKRLLMEVRALNKCRRSGVTVPAIYFVDPVVNRIYMERIDGETVRQYLMDKGESTDDTIRQQVERVCTDIGRDIAKMHTVGVIHGDLTTSNMMLRRDSNNSDLSVVFIDFGLSYISLLTEDKAVDLYVLERAFVSTHPNSETLFGCLLKGYAQGSTKSKEILKRLDQVRQRGRKKLAFG
eukprot:gene11961-13941_t